MLYDLVPSTCEWHPPPVTLPTARHACSPHACQNYQRLRVVLCALQLGFDVLFSDLDVMWLKASAVEMDSVMSLTDKAGSRTRVCRCKLLNSSLLQHGDVVSNSKSIADQPPAGESMVFRSLFAFLHAKWLSPSLHFPPFPFSLSTALTPLLLLVDSLPPFRTLSPTSSISRATWC